MSSSPDLLWQPALPFTGDVVRVDRTFSRVRRIQLDAESWIDHGPEWVSGSDALFAEILATRPWGQRSRRMYDQVVQEPRLTAPWNLASGEPLEPPVLEEIRVLLTDRYEREFDSVGFNLYRDGTDSVAWHGDRIDKQIDRPIVALVCLGEPRKFLLRPKGGGSSLSFFLGRGDLLVTGGQTQRTWEHSVPKVSRAGPRISVGYRHSTSGTRPPGVGEE